MVKDFVIVSDLGAAGNLVRNLMLSGETDWPMVTDKFTTILNQYPRNLELKDWLQQENRLRFWLHYYKLDLSNELNFAQFLKLPQAKLPRVWLNHSAFWQPDQFEMFVNHCNVVYVAPTTAHGLEWQIRSYASKKTIPLLHDFCFEQDREQQKQQYIDTHGAEAYYLLNITNMKHIIDQRQQEFRLKIPHAHCIDLEVLVNGTVASIQDALTQATGLHIEIGTIEQVVNAWRQLHWSSTEEWNYHKIFQQ
jgi:hypothetical protein